MGDKRVLAGSPQDMRWQPGVVPGLVVPEPEPEPAVEPELATEDLAAVAVTPRDLPSEVPEVPPVADTSEPVPVVEPTKPADSSAQESAVE